LGPGRQADVIRLRATDGTPAYRRALIDFEELATDQEAPITPLLFELRRLTRNIRQ
jgi:hypothetical protein